MPKLSEKESLLLEKIALSKRFPIARFELRSTKDNQLRSTALNNVILFHKNDSMEKVKEYGSILTSLEGKGLINIDFTLKVAVSSDYEIYYQSSVYGMLCELAEQAKGKKDFLFDIPAIKKGLVKLTPLGKSYLSK